MTGPKLLVGKGNLRAARRMEEKERDQRVGTTWKTLILGKIQRKLYLGGSSVKTKQVTKAATLQ